MRDIILYYYDHSDEMEFLNDIQEKIARKNKTTKTKVRDALNSYIRKIKTSSFSSYSTELNKILYNNGYTTSLKDFVHRIVLYIIREKENGRLLYKMVPIK